MKINKRRGGPNKLRKVGRGGPNKLRKVGRNRKINQRPPIANQIK